MVSPIPGQTDPVGNVIASNRGFIPEETVIGAGPSNLSMTMYYRPFWRPVVAGTVFALSVFVLSWYLMLGCHVGVAADSSISLGGGSAIWLWATACVAYYFGGMIASAMTSFGPATTSYTSGWLKGAVLWGLSIPLALLAFAFMSRTGGMLADLHLPHAVAFTNTVVPGIASAMGFYWSAFITLGLALIFSIFGAVSGSACRDDQAA